MVCSFIRLISFSCFPSADCSGAHNREPPSSPNFEDTPNTPAPGAVLLPEGHQHSRQSSPPPYSSSRAISAAFQSTIVASAALDCSIKESGDAETPPALLRTSPLSLTDLSEKPLQRSQGAQSSRLPQVLPEPKEAPAASSPPVPAAPVIGEEPFSHLLSNRPAGRAQTPAVCTDATVGDQLWCKPGPSSQQESMSSSSSVSSSDTVIDLSLPNPAVKNLKRFSAVSTFRDPARVARTRSPLTSRQSQRREGKLTPRPTSPRLKGSVDSPSDPLQRRHTWSRLYMEELKQWSVRRPSSAAASDSVSKSLGDLTSEDISCHCESTYRSISRSFISRPTGEQKPAGGREPQPGDNLTQRLRQLASVEPLTAKDFAPECSAGEMPEEAAGARRRSRSHSRVRYIANRTKRAQERQLLQGRSASFSFPTCAGSGSRASPIEERGNPEGACSSAHSTCPSEDPLEQLELLASRSPRASRPLAEADNTEVFFLLRL